jgi:glycosyltransferase involved in cell wall biosynthesis
MNFLQLIQNSPSLRAGFHHDMKVVIAHYHLNPGGVTRIIGTQVRTLMSLDPNLEITVLTGSEGEIAIPAKHIQVHPELNYNDCLTPGLLKETAALLEEMLRKCFSHQTILHVHNPNLGKNPALTLAIYHLAGEGFPIVNHCHDFPETRPYNLGVLHKHIPELTGRPLDEILYPCPPNCHYITLNSCDHQFISEKGIPDEQNHLLANPVYKQPSQHTHKLETRKRICRTLGFEPSRMLCTYPVRAIERKNLGEFILLAILFAHKASFSVTQAPKNPREIEGYEQWKIFCNRHGIELKFESGTQVNHEELIMVSDFCLTTSIAEGFGMVYLEPWLLETPVIGRNLHCITADLERQGMEFPRLYQQILVETPRGRVDFKDLAAMEQQKYLEDMMHNSLTKHKLFRDNPFLINFLDRLPGDIITRNRKTVEAHFSPEKYGNQLLAIYREISGWDHHHAS